MAIYYVNSGSIDNLTVSKMTSGSINVSIDGGSTNNVSQLVFSNANNVTFGLAGSTITATAAAGGAGAVQSYYANYPVFQGSSTYALSSALNLVNPFVLPYDVSASYMRVLMTNTINSTSFNTSQTYSINNTFRQTWFANIYTLNNGTLSLYTGLSAGWSMQVGVSIGAATNQQTIYHSITYPVTGSTATYTTNYALSNLSCQVSTTHLTQFNTNRFLDIPFNGSIAAGDYWVAFQKSTAISTAVGPGSAATAGTVLTAVTHNNSMYVATQINLNFGAFGAASNVSTQGLNIGQGAWSAAAAGGTTNAIAVSDVRTTASHPVVPFQLIRGSNLY